MMKNAWNGMNGQKTWMIQKIRDNMIDKDKNKIKNIKKSIFFISRDKNKKNAYLSNKINL